MGWKLTNEAIATNESEPSLKSDHCGMEIIADIFFIEKNIIVKIRPLWDGNAQQLMTFGAGNIVKIRPLWDGNIAVIGKACGFYIVLKSDHCGMEIF